MGKTRKNSNYQTEKRIAARLEQENEAKRASRARLIRLITIPIVSVVLIVSIILGAVGCSQGWFGFKTTHIATITIRNYGTVELELYGEEAPITVANFVKLANEGYYDGTTFHRIIDGFMAQGGAGDGSASTIKGEFSENGVWNRIKHERGTISMARSDIPDSATSQFFIVHRTSSNNSKSLDGKYAAFGKVTKGMEVIDSICAGVNSDNLPEESRPFILFVDVKTVEEIAEIEAIEKELENKD